MAGIVVSTEYVELTFGTSDTLQQTNLSKGQAHANTIVFEARAYDNGTDSSDVFDARMFDAWVDDNGGTARLNVERQTASGAAVVRCFVVEFDSSAVTVQKGTWTFGNSLTATASITAVTTTAAFIKAFGKCVAASTDDYEDHIFRYHFNSATEIGFQRTSTAGNGDPGGHWHVVEADGGEFTVEHVTHTAGGSSGAETVSITAVSALADAFLDFSHDNNEAADDIRDAVWNAWLSSTTQVTAHRGNGGTIGFGQIDDLNIQVVEAQNSEFSVQRVSDTQQSTAGDESESITAVADTAFTTVHLNLARSHSPAEANSTNGADGWTHMVAAELASSSTIEVFAGSSAAKRYSAEIIEWGEAAVGHTGTSVVSVPSPTVTGAGAHPITGTGVASAALPSVESAGQHPLTGASVAAVAAPTVSGAGEQPHEGTSVVTAPLPSVAGAGVQTHEGASVVTAETPTVASSGAQSEGHTGTSVVAVEIPTLVSSGEQPHAGTSVVAAETPTVAATGEQPHQGTSAVVVAAPTAAGSGQQPHQGASVVTAATPVATGSGTHSEATTGTSVRHGPDPGGRRGRRSAPRRHQRRRGDLAHSRRDWLSPPGRHLDNSRPVSVCQQHR